MSKKRMLSLLCAALLLFSVVDSAAAAESELRASPLFSGYGASLEADGDGKMTFRFVVYAPQIVKKIGAQKVEIKHLVGDDWVTYKIFTAVANPTFYDYDAAISDHTKTFEAEVGETYKAVLTAYSEGKDGTSATRTTESYTAVCR